MSRWRQEKREKQELILESVVVTKDLGKQELALLLAFQETAVGSRFYSEDVSSHKSTTATTITATNNNNSIKQHQNASII